MTFPHATCAFLKDLARNNNREWFAANKPRYQLEWLEPATAFVSEVSASMAALAPPHEAQARINGSIRRLQRDTRFSQDKTPYDPKLHLIFWTGDHPNRSPAIHVVLHPERLGIGAGLFAMNAAQLDRYRHAIATNRSARGQLDDILTGLRHYDCALTDETLKRAPKGFDVAEPHQTLLKRKGLVVHNHQAALAPETIADAAWMASFYDAAAALNHWLVENVGDG
ncbi:MAG: DUF2461 domain-containing protein [Pseudomonadota bacterium]